MNNYVIISGFNIHDSNRGTAALSYGSVSFLAEYQNLRKDDIIVVPHSVKKWWKYKDIQDIVECKNGTFTITHFHYFFLEAKLLMMFGVVLPFTRFGKIMCNLKYVAAINGGDGFSDIYGTSSFQGRLKETLFAIKLGKEVVQLPQTIGPFTDSANYNLAKDILRYSSKVYIRDDCFTDELGNMEVEYSLVNDLSAFMMPQPFDIEIEKNAIGLNISGLTYSNKFGDLSGQFDHYPALCYKIIEYFQNIDKPVYLISHTYNYTNPISNQDDMVSTREFYSRLKNKESVYLIDRDLTSPQTKYVISQMSFFIGTRMHANFAAIFTKVPVFGLAYSYKFEGAFNRNGIYGQTAMINNISIEDIGDIVKKISTTYERSIVKN